MKRILTAVLVILFPVWTVAQVVTNGDITVRSHPEGARVTLSGEVDVTGITPARFRHLLIGDYKLILKRPGYESYSTRIMLDPTRQMEFDIKLSPITQFKAAARSLFIPGLGQWYSGQKTKGFFLTTLALGSTVAYLIADADFDDKYLAFEDKLDQYDSILKRGNIRELRLVKMELDKAQKEAYDAENVRRVTIGTVMAVWGISLLDILFFFPEKPATVAVKGLTVRPEADFERMGLIITKRF